MIPLGAVVPPRGVASGVADRQIAAEADNSGVLVRRTGRGPGGVLRARRGVETEETAAKLGYRHHATSRGRRVSVGITLRADKPCVSCCAPASARCTRC